MFTITQEVISIQLLWWPTSATVMRKAHSKIENLLSKKKSSEQKRKPHNKKKSLLQKRKAHGKKEKLAAEIKNPWQR